MNYIIESEETADFNDEEKSLSKLIETVKRNRAEKIFCLVDESKSALKQFLFHTALDENLKPVIRNIAGSLQNLFELNYDLRNEDICLIKTDSVFSDEEFHDFINYSVLQNEADGIIGITKNINNERPLCVALDENDFILKFSELKEGYNWAVNGVYFFSHKVIEIGSFAVNNRITDIKDFLRLLISKGYLIKGFLFNSQI